MRDEYQTKNNIAGAFGMGAFGDAAMQQQACEKRQSAKSRLRFRVKELRQEADRLEALGNALPEVLPPQADDALWALLDNF